MIITKMSASFGQLEQETLTLEPGLNIIEAPNEGGKSTWSAFIVAMFYGIDTTKRDKKGYLSEKTRYSPWSGVPMAGTIECIYEGRELILERSGKRAGTPMSQFSARYKDTGEPVPNLTGDTVGPILLGVEREVFVRSAFIRQSGLAIDGAPELERRIAALVSSGEEETSYSEAAGRLKNWQNRRKHNRTGRIPELKAQLEQVETDLRTVEQTRELIAQCSLEREALEQRQQILQTMKTQWDQWERKVQLQKKEEVKVQMQQGQIERAQIVLEMNQFGSMPEEQTLRDGLGLVSQMERLIQAQQEIQVSPSEEEVEQPQEDIPAVFEGKTPDEAWEEAQKAAETCRVLEKKSVFRPWLFAILCFLSFALIGTVIVLSMGEPSITTLIALCCAALLCAMLPVILLTWYRRRTAVLAEQFEILQRYRAKTPEEILTQAVAYREAVARRDQLQTQAELAAQMEARQQAERLNVQQSLFQLVHSFAPEAHTLEEARAALNRGLQLWDARNRLDLRLDGLQQLYDAMPGNTVDEESFALASPPELSREQVKSDLEQVQKQRTYVMERMAMAQGEQKAQGDPDVLFAQREELLGQIAQLEMEWEAIGLAQAALEEAHMELQARFSPALNQRAAQYLSLFTGEKYNEILLDRSFTAAVRSGTDSISRPAIGLSQGTMDQLYLAVRLAICELALPDKEHPPLILDDALINFDETRMQKALECICNIAEKWQVLLFTCHKREAEYIQKTGRGTVLRLAPSE